MTYETVLTQAFSGALPEAEFVDRTYRALSEHGFSADTAIACVGTCRDEISQSLVEAICDAWGHAFNLSSLAGMFLAGATGLAAAMHHAPDIGGRERYVFYSFPHIAVDTIGRVGVCTRQGRLGESTACGALHALQREIAGGKIDPSVDFNDLELSVLRTRLLREIPYGQSPDLLELTKIAQKAIQADLERALEQRIDKDSCDYAVITGIQVHGPDGNYIWPVSSYAVVNGTRVELDIR